MKLKDFFIALAKYDQEVEIYFNQENGDAIFGFKINQIDVNELNDLNNYESILDSILNEINNGFIENSDLIEKGEGDTTYKVHSDFSCIKKAKYFDWVTESEQFWIEDNETDFVFEKVIFPFDSISIYKDLNNFKIDEEINLNRIISKETYESFKSFYENLLNEFQEMEIELQFDIDDDNNTKCYINQMDGAYSKKMDFTLLDNSKVDFSEEELQNLLLNNFKAKQYLVDKILFKK
jgi:hypothetical protein